jgi:hypothetical protein
MTKADARPVAAFINHNPAFFYGTLSSVPSPLAGPDWCEAPVPALNDSTDTDPADIDSDDSDPAGHDPTDPKPTHTYPSDSDSVAPDLADPTPAATDHGQRRALE